MGNIFAVQKINCNQVMPMANLKSQESQPANISCIFDKELDNKEKNSIIFSFSVIVSTFSYELFKNVLNNFATIAEKNMDKYEKMLNQN